MNANIIQTIKTICRKIKKNNEVITFYTRTACLVTEYLVDAHGY